MFISTRKLQLIAVCWIVGLLLEACTAGDMVRIATSRNPRAAAKSIITSRPSRYKTNPYLLVRDIRFLKRRFDKLFNAHKKNAGKRWGRANSTMPSTHVYVKYTDNYLSRTIIDFDQGTIRIETLARTRQNERLHNAIVTTLLTPEDPRAIDLFSARTTRLSGKPYLYGLVNDQRGRAIATPHQAERYARFLVQRKQIRNTRKNGDRIQIAYVQLVMINGLHHRSAQRYAPWVDRYSRQFHISRSLIYAIMATESNFNPYAVSHAPAYGLMQLVPHTGGRDAYKRVFGRDKIPSDDFLFKPHNNIRLGIAYLNVLYYQQLRDIRDPISREYCTIAAYNTGTGNVFAAFSKNRARAIERINSMSPSHLYRYLRRHLHHPEARAYVHKVVNARPKYATL